MKSIDKWKIQPLRFGKFEKIFLGIILFYIIMDIFFSDGFHAILDNNPISNFIFLGSLILGFLYISFRIMIQTSEYWEKKLGLKKKK